jgi:hypothetical protein
MTPPIKVTNSLMIGEVLNVWAKSVGTHCKSKLPESIAERNEPITMPTINIKSQWSSGTTFWKYGLSSVRFPRNLASTIPENLAKAVEHPKLRSDKRKVTQLRRPIPIPAIYGDHLGTVNHDIIYLPLFNDIDDLTIIYLTKYTCNNIILDTTFISDRESLIN